MSTRGIVKGLLCATVLFVLIGLIGCNSSNSKEAPSGGNRTVDTASAPYDKITDSDSLLPFLENGDLIWKASDFKIMYLDYWQERKDYEGVSSEINKEADFQTFIKILSEMRKTLIYTEKASDSFEKTSEKGVLPPDSELGDIVFHFGPTLPDNAFLQVLKADDCAYLRFRLENKESELEHYHSSVYYISLRDFEKLENFLIGLDKNTETLAGKPVLYLYPEHESDISVKLDFDGLLGVTYPAYESGWNVRAYPDGHLINYSDTQEYSYLFWEGVPRNANWELSEGYCIPGADTAAFLQQKLMGFGLIPKEYNEFIVYWLPQMQNNPYNLITFQWDEYERIAPLEISPEPDSILRVFMVFTPLQEPVEISPPSDRAMFVRRGFTVVEWGALKMQDS